MKIIKLCIVVYRTIPTSNHNQRAQMYLKTGLYIVLFLHQTTTFCDSSRVDVQLYIVLFLHQTTTLQKYIERNKRCISYYSYIKPQLEC